MRLNKGPLGAIMDEYDRAATEYIRVIQSVDTPTYESVLDPITHDEDCRSIQGICNHVLLAGYGYANAIRRTFGVAVTSPERSVPAHSTFPNVMSAMLAYTEETLSDRYSMTEDELNATNIPLRWSDHHDMEALMEHAVMHILRHRRQIERLLSRTA